MDNVNYGAVKELLEKEALDAQKSIIRQRKIKALEDGANNYLGVVNTT